MPAVRTLADGRIKYTILTTAPADLEAITVAELSAGIEASCKVAANGTRFSATASDTISDPAFCEDANSSVPGRSNYEGTVAPFVLYDDTTQAYQAGDNEVFEALRAKGTRAWHVFRKGPAYDQAWAAGDVYSVYEGVTDNPQEPSDTAGYFKANVPVMVNKAELHGTVAGA